MIGTEPIQQILTAAFYTPYIEDEKSLSILLAAKVESGKTELVSRYKENPGVKYLTDATAFSLIRDMSTEIQMGEVKTMIFPDLLTPFAKDSSTVGSFIAFLTNLSEEGIAEMHSGFLEEGGIVMTSPQVVSIIGCIPKDQLEDRRHKWARAGFMSRMLPVSYRYSRQMITEIKDSIKSRVYISDSPIALDVEWIPKTKVTLPSGIEIIKQKVPVELPKYLAEHLSDAEEKIAALDKTKMNYTYGFRLQKQLQRLVMGYALSQQRDYVTGADIDVFWDEMFPFLNLDYTKLLCPGEKDYEDADDLAEKKRLEEAEKKKLLEGKK